MSQLTRRQLAAVSVGAGLWSFGLAVPAFRRSASIAGDDWALLRSSGRMIAGLTVVPPLHVYAVHSDVQVGPLALAMDGLAQRWLGGDWFLLGLISVLAGVAVWALGRLGAQGRELLVLGLILSTVWATLGGWGHVEDALAVAAIMWAVVAVREDRPLVVGLLLGLAVACKPWALIAAPLLLALPVRDSWRAASVLVVLALVPWLPFVLADRQTWDVTRYSWPISAGSSLHALGLAGSTAPWLRPVQIGLGAAACGWVARRRLLLAPLAGVAIKVLLDPQAWAYYGLVPVAGAVLVDLDGDRRLPLWSLSAAVVFFFVPAALPADVSGFVRAAWAISTLALLVWKARTPSRQTRPALGSLAQLSVVE